METQIMPVNPCRTYKQYRTKMATHAKEVKLYEMNSPINLNIAKQKETERQDDRGMYGFNTSYTLAKPDE